MFGRNQILQLLIGPNLLDLVLSNIFGRNFIKSSPGVDFIDQFRR
jgi:hypothetical protein